MPRNMPATSGDTCVAYRSSPREAALPFSPIWSTSSNVNVFSCCNPGTEMVAPRGAAAVALLSHGSAAIDPCSGACVAAARSTASATPHPSSSSFASSGRTCATTRTLSPPEAHEEHVDAVSEAAVSEAQGQQGDGDAYFAWSCAAVSRPLAASVGDARRKGRGWTGAARVTDADARMVRRMPRDAKSRRRQWASGTDDGPSGSACNSRTTVTASRRHGSGIRQTSATTDPPCTAVRLSTRLDPAHCASEWEKLLLQPALTLAVPPPCASTRPNPPAGREVCSSDLHHARCTPFAGRLPGQRLLPVRRNAPSALDWNDPSRRVVLTLCLDACQRCVHLQPHRAGLARLGVLLPLALVRKAADRAHDYSSAGREELVRVHRLMHAHRRLLHRVATHARHLDDGRARDARQDGPGERRRFDGLALDAEDVARRHLLQVGVALCVQASSCLQPWCRPFRQALRGGSAPPQSGQSASAGRP
eukprot:356995-Chlamydomonas_euryale.AAC.10